MPSSRRHRGGPDAGLRPYGGGALAGRYPIRGTGPRVDRRGVGPPPGAHRLSPRAARAHRGTAWAAAPPSVPSAKGELGHTPGAAGAIEAALTVLAVVRQIAPTAANFSPGDRGTAVIGLVVGAVREQRIGLSPSNSCAFGGHHNAAPAFPPAR